MDDQPNNPNVGDSESWSVAEFLSLRRRAKLWLFPVAVALLGLVGSWIAVGAIERAFQQTLEKKLGTIVASTANSVELWSERQTLNARILAEDDRTERLVARLVTSLDTHTQASALEELTERLESASKQFGFASYTVIDSTGETLATNTAICNFSDSLLSQFSQVFCGETVFAEPSSASETEMTGESMALWVAAPIQTRRSDETLATLICEIPSDGQFQRTLAVSKFGESGHNFAVDRNGRILGVDANAHGPTQSIPQSLAIDESGDAITVDAKGFVDAAGNRLVGGTRWLPDFGLGVVSTIDYDEAYASHNLFKSINAVVTSLALLGSCIGLVYTWYLSRAQLRAMKAERKLKQLGQYSLEEKIGEGGMGEVYRSTHRMLRRPTAVKLLPAEKSSLQTIERFEREVQLTSQLTHPNTISIYDYGRTSDGVFYYAMEYLDGVDLKKLVEREGAQPEARVVHILRQICGSLKEAHDRDLVHRDIKPANIILCSRGGQYDVAKVLDFGLVYDTKCIKASMEKSGISGTPAFMSPESIESPASLDQRSDIYAIGAVAYLLLTGSYTFTGLSVTEIWDQQLESEPVPPSRRTTNAISRSLEDLVMQCLAIDPQARPQSVERVNELLGELPNWSQDEALQRWTSKAKPQTREQIPINHPAETLAYTL